MNNTDKENLLALLNQTLEDFMKKNALPGIHTEGYREVFSQQLVDSIRRVQYVYTLRKRPLSIDCTNPSNAAFDPVKASVYFQRHNNIDESFWLIFLITHFGKNLTKHWKMIFDVYGKLGAGVWQWPDTPSSQNDFLNWIDSVHTEIPIAFGNHRKYETLKTDSKSSTSNVIRTYFDWVGSSHTVLANKLINEAGTDKRLLFRHLYDSMSAVYRFGRTAKFDYLTMVGKVGLLDIEPGETFMSGATGPKTGAQLLFAGNHSTNISCQELERRVAKLEEALPLGQMGMQVMEDALCNWQKSPHRYKLFRG